MSTYDLRSIRNIIRSFAPRCNRGCKVTATKQEYIDRVKANFPQELTERPQWVVWKYEPKPGSDKPTKVLYNPGTPTYKASSTSPKTWGTLQQALKAAQLPGVDGIGFVFSKDDPYIGIDFDNCVDENGIIDPVVTGWIESFDNYAEFSPSGKGIHIIARATLPGKGIKHGGIEMYSEARFFTMTGDKVPGSPQNATEATETAQALYEYITAQKPQKPGSASPAQPRSELDIDDSTLLKLAFRAKNGTKIKKLWAGDIAGYKTQSEADFALAGMLAFWTGGSAARVEQLMLASGLNRDKFQTKRGSSSYLKQTVGRAIEGCTKFYAPARTDEVWAKLKALREFITLYRWEGRRAETLQRCALAILRRFEEAHSIETHFSTSQIATMAGVGTATAVRCLHGNVNKETGEVTDGLKHILPIERSQKSNGLLASTWRITDKVFVSELIHHKSNNTQDDCEYKDLVVYQLVNNSSVSKQSKFIESFLSDDSFQRSTNRATERSAASDVSERSELDVTQALSELFNRDVTANQAGKSFSNIGLRIVAYLDASPTKSATVADLAEALGKHPQTIRATLHRMTDALRIHDCEGVLELSTLASAGNPTLATLPEDWRERLDRARPNLASYGKHEARLQAVAARRLMRLATIYRMARREDTKEMIAGIMDRQRAVMAYGEGDLPRLDRLLSRVESHIIEAEPEAVAELATIARTAPEAPAWLVAEWVEGEIIERVYLGSISDEMFGQRVEVYQ